MDAEIDTLFDSYESLAADFRRDTANHHALVTVMKILESQEDPISMLQKICNNNINNNENDSNNVLRSIEQDFAELQKIYDDIELENKLVSEIAADIEKEKTIARKRSEILPKSTQSDAWKENINSNNQMLQRLNSECIDLESNIEKRVNQCNELRSEIQAMENRRLNEENTSKMEIDNDTIKQLEAQKNELTLLLQGVQSLVGVESSQVSRDADGKLSLQVIVGGVKVEILLNASSKKVVGINVPSGSPPLSWDPSRVLHEASSLSAPQDLRYIVHCLQAAVDSRRALLSHLAEVKKTCLVKQIEEGHRYSLTLRNGITAEVVFNDLYNTMPGSLAIRSLLGVGGWTQEQLTSLQMETNNMCLFDIRDLIAHLNALQ